MTGGEGRKLTARTDELAPPSRTPSPTAGQQQSNRTVSVTSGHPDLRAFRVRADRWFVGEVGITFYRSEQAVAWFPHGATVAVVDEEVQA